MADQKVIYDLGANRGDNIPYYSKKADLVIAVEANPTLCKEIEARFAAEIAAERLRVENCVIVGEGAAAEVSFYLHKRHHVLGQFPRPDESVIGDYDELVLPAKSISEIVRTHGKPAYIKIDIEHSEEAVLTELFRGGVRPPYISAESHSIRVFALLAGMGEYRAFKLVEGETVAKDYKNASIQMSGGRESYSFPEHSAGPFGDDVAGEWMNADDLFEVLAERGMGWRDIHATTMVEPDPMARAEKSRLKRRHVRGWLKAKMR